MARKTLDGFDVNPLNVSLNVATRASRPRLQFGHFRRGTNVEPEVDAWIAAQRLNRIAQVLL